MPLPYPDPPYMRHSATVLVVENREPTAKELASARVVIRVDAHRVRPIGEIRAALPTASATVLKDNLGGNAVRIIKREDQEDA